VLDSAVDGVVLVGVIDPPLHFEMVLEPLDLLLDPLELCYFMLEGSFVVFNPHLDHLNIKLSSFCHPYYRQDKTPIMWVLRQEV